MGPGGLPLVSDLVLDTFWRRYPVLYCGLAHQKSRLSFIGLEVNCCYFIRVSSWPHHDLHVQHQFDYFV